MELGHGWWIVMIAGMAVFWTLVIVASVWVLHSLTTHEAPQTAIDLLDRSFARGEISPEEYRERREALAS
jgi:uncharacterized membrane protein